MKTRPKNQYLKVTREDLYVDLGLPLEVDKLEKLAMLDCTARIHDDDFFSIESLYRSVFNLFYC